MKKKESFTLSEEALRDHLTFLEKKDPSIIFKTCEMLSALMIVSLPPKQAYPFVVEVINSMRKDGKLPWDEEKWGSFDVQSLDKYLPEIRTSRGWAFSFKKYLRDKILNSLTVDYKRRRKHVPLFTEASDQEEESGEAENPKVVKRTGRNEFTEEKKIHESLEIEELMKTAKLTDQEKKIFYFKSLTDFTELFIADQLGVTRDIVKHDYKQAQGKLQKAIMRKR